MDPQHSLYKEHDCVRVDAVSHHQHGSNIQHARHNKHAGHSSSMFKQRFFVCLLLTLPILYLSPMFQMWLGYKAILFSNIDWATPIIAIFIYVYGGWVFLKGAWAEFHGKIGMMTLIALAITVSFIYSVAVTLGLPGDSFYMELATLVDVLLLGHWIEMASVQGASRTLEHLADLVPAIAHKQLNGKIEDVAVNALREGDQILIRPGEQVPIDGETIAGISSVNEAFLTGESRPVIKSVGDEVVGGAVNGEGALTIAVTRTGAKTTLSQIMRLVEGAQTSKSQYQHLADRLAYWLTLIAISVATLTFVIWLSLSNGGLTSAINRAVSVLVITCPHALGLAIPLVIVNASAMSAKHGIVVRNREAFECANNIKTIAFDKTGTLTEGQFSIHRIYVEGVSELDALIVAASLESLSEHPLGRPIVAEANRRQSQLAKVTEFQAVPGRGVQGKIDGQHYRLGRPEWGAEYNLQFPVSLQTEIVQFESQGESAVVLLNDQQVLAVFGLVDRVRGQARAAIERLHKMGIETVMITGDAEIVARTVAVDLKIDHYYARVLPKNKASLIRRLKADRPTAFVGDGINDAPALSEADLGIAIGAGTNVAIESADLVLVSSDLADVAYALSLATAAYNKMIQNLFWASGYNIVGIPLAAGVAYPLGVVISPTLAALFMTISTVVVSINAMLLRRMKN
jgi:P-type Cu2+ transporter